MKYSIKVTNIEGRINLIKVLRTLEPGLTLLDAKKLVWEEKIVDLSKIRRARHPLRNFEHDFVFSQAEYEYMTWELDDLVDFIVEKKEGPAAPSIEEAFRAGFEAGIASDLDVEEALAQFLAAGQKETDINLEEEEEEHRAGAEEIRQLDKTREL